MTEVKGIPGLGMCLFATTPYSVGDVIVKESKPLIRLAPGSPVDDEKLRDNFVYLNSKGESKDDRITFWEFINVPKTIPSYNHGKFKGMVQAATCFANQDNLSPQSREAFLNLYHPSLDDLSEEENEIIAVSKAAIQFLVEYKRIGSKLDFLLEDETLVQKVMLIWSCNAFDGGRVYHEISRINHSCNPNAVVQADKQSDEQVIRAAAPISIGEEITISYLGILLYADKPTRQSNLRKTKHFECRCDRCTNSLDYAYCLPCPSCHPRQKQLDEDVQYDDDQTVRYACAKNTGELFCKSCGNSFDEKEGKYKELMHSCRKVTNHVADFLSHRSVAFNQPRDEDDEAIESDLLEQHAQLASSVLGAKHWTTNLVMLLLLNQQLARFHSNLIANSEEDPDNMESLAENIDMLERLCRYVDGLSLKLDKGHLLSDVIISVARALVSLGDTKSQKYAAEWLEKIDEYVEQFETDMTKKVVGALRVAWQRDESEQQRAAKRPKTVLHSK